MRIPKLIFLFILVVSVLSFSNGCRSLPDVAEVIDEAPTAQKPRQILSSKGLLPPQKSKDIMDRLKRSVDPTDFLERYTAVIELVTESPLFGKALR